MLYTVALYAMPQRKMSTKKRKNYTNSTLLFCLVGLFIPGLTIYVILGAQLIIEKLGVKCHFIWPILWTIAAIGAIVTPLIFVRLMNSKLKTGYNYPNNKILNFNIIELTFIQCALGAFFSNAHTLCYGNGGQNGLEYIFTGWLALPLIIIFSLIFDKLRANKIKEIKLNR
ncbi:hypothetical protein JKA74_16500 [Marivirga sp. S37H4]|uniref:Uncharacterized protein n=1 Tax=Marivirga aurantiaca TaxID=2802615 RepID=A0A934X0G5_9BACT|nr:hypothetical protein [Marivirga aurantiaca]MBK6266648.1 hypothetical protein [Marivirga aurantiaca]